MADGFAQVYRFLSVLINLSGAAFPALAQRGAPARARSLNRWIFPVAVFGSSGTNSTQRGYL
jgi:hypothetical protein